MERLHGQGSPQADASFPLYAHPSEHKPVPAAVLVPIVNRPGGLTLMFTQRTAHLHDHAGQISFPGGRVDEGDSDRIATALREAQEETGLSPSRVEIIGRLPEYDIPTGFRVTPVVGWVFARDTRKRLVALKVAVESRRTLQGLPLSCPGDQVETIR